jgi:hypothetical protein
MPTEKEIAEFKRRLEYIREQNRKKEKECKTTSIKKQD